MAGGWTIERLRTERQRARTPDRRRKEMGMQREKLAGGKNVRNEASINQSIKYRSSNAFKWCECDMNE